MGVCTCKTRNRDSSVQRTPRLSKSLQSGGRASAEPNVLKGGRHVQGVGRSTIFFFLIICQYTITSQVYFVISNENFICCMNTLVSLYHFSLHIHNSYVTM